MEKISPETLRQAQKVLLESLVWFDGVCQKHGLRYWLDSGTLLGAQRHKGFIPWDDDIDISMPVEDYEQFKEIALHEKNDGIFFQTSSTDPEFPFDYIKLRSNKATIIEFHEQHRDIAYHQGVFVDIFPMLTIKNTKFHLLFYRLSFAVIRFFSAKHWRNDGMRHFFVSMLHRLHKGWERRDTRIVYGGEMPDVAASFDPESVFPLQKMRFEKRSFFGPVNPGDCLEQIYSFNFMEIPPEDKRVVHAANIFINSSLEEV